VWVIQEIVLQLKTLAALCCWSLLQQAWKYSQDQMTEVSNEIDYMQHGNSWLLNADPKTTPDITSIGTQCDLLAAPPLKPLPCADTTTESSEPEDTDADDSFQISQDEATTE